MRVLTFTLLLTPFSILAQNKVGVGTTQPEHPFQVNVDSAYIVNVLDQSLSPQVGFTPGLAIAVGDKGAQPLPVEQTGQLKQMVFYFALPTDADQVLVEVFTGSVPGSGTLLTSATLTDVILGVDTAFFPMPWPQVTAGDTVHVVMTHVAGASLKWKQAVWDDSGYHYTGGVWNPISIALTIQSFITYPDTTIHQVLKVRDDRRVMINDYALPRYDGEPGQILQTNGNGDVTWMPSNVLSQPTQLTDADQDTRVEVEVVPDEDIIRMTTNDEERLTILQNGKIGINTPDPVSDLDVRGDDDVQDGGELQLATPGMTNFIRMFGGRMGDRNPFLAFSDQDTFRLVTTSADWNTFNRRWTFTPDGKMGLGLQKPDGMLHLYGNSLTAFPQLRLTESSANDFTRIKFENQLEPGISWDIAARADSSASSSRLNFYYANPGFTGDKMTITGEGNVGIGTTNPGNRLRVNGSSTSSQHVLSAGTNYSGNVHIRAIEGFSTPGVGYGIAGYFVGGYKAIDATAEGGAATGTVTGVEATAHGTAGTRIGLFGAATGGTTNWAGYFGPGHVRVENNLLIDDHVGIGNTSPATALDVSGKIKIGNDADAAHAGMMRWNSGTGDFEGYNGTAWVSFTKQNLTNGWGNATVYAHQNESISNSQFDGNARMGYSLHMNGNYAIVGLPRSSENGSLEGRAMVYFFNGTDWVFQQALEPPDGNAQDLFGTSVCITDQYAVIGSPAADLNGISNRGKAYIFERSGTNWLHEDTKYAVDAIANDSFGYSVAIHGIDIIVGAPYKDVGGNANQGKVYFYEFDGTNWVSAGSLTASDGTSDDLYGYSVALNSGYAIVGAEGAGTVGEGKAYINYWNGSWLQQAIMSGPFGAVSMGFGASVSISGEYAAIGTKSSSTIAGELAYVYKRNMTTWSEQAVLSAPDEMANSDFGAAVSISGSWLVVGAPLNPFGGAAQAGKSFVYERNGTAWLPKAVFLALDAQPNYQFGYSVSVSGNRVIVGAPFWGSAGQGKIYFFENQ